MGFKRNASAKVRTHYICVDMHGELQMYKLVE